MRYGRLDRPAATGGGSCRAKLALYIALLVVGPQLTLSPMHARTASPLLPKQNSPRPPARISPPGDDCWNSTLPFPFSSF